MFRTKEDIRFKIRFHSGIDKELGLVRYNPFQGIELKTKTGSSLKSALKQIGYKKNRHHAFFCDGDRINLKYKLSHDDQIECLTPSAGG